MAKKASSKKTSSPRAKKAAKKATSKPAAKKVAKKTAATMTVKKAASKPVKKAAKKTVKKTAPKAVKKTVARKTTKKAPPKVDPPKVVKKRVLKKTKLSKSTLDKFRALLLERRRDMIGDMNGLEAETIGAGRNGSGDLSNMPTHPADLGTDNYEHEFSLGLLESERQMLIEIDEALLRINEGTYGMCLGTGQAIGMPRLRAKPWAKYCIEYARKVEQGLVRPGEDDDDIEDEDYGP